MPIKVENVMHVSDDGRRAIFANPDNPQSWDCYVWRADSWRYAGLSASEALARRWLAGERLE